MSTTETETEVESTSNEKSGSFIKNLRKGVVNEFKENNWEGFFTSSITIFIGVIIYGFVGANLTSILCWPIADFNKGFPTNIDKPPYMGDPPSEPNFWSEKFGKGLENCDIEEIGEVFWPMEHVSYPYTMNRPSEEMMDMGMEWYYTWVCKFFGMSAAYSWSYARYFMRWSLLFFKIFPTLMNNTAIPFYVMPYVFYIISTTIVPIVFGYVTTWLGMIFSPAEQGYLLWLSTWVSAFNAMSGFIANLMLAWYTGGVVMPFTTLIMVLVVYSIIMSFIQYGWAIVQGISQYYIFMVFCFTGGLFKNGGLYKISELMWSHRKGLLVIFMFYTWAASTGFLTSQSVLGIFVGFVLCTIMLFTEKTKSGDDGLSVPVDNKGNIDK